MKYLIVGLGNIGDEYANTRHNIGFNIVDALAKEAGVRFEDKRYGFVAEIRIKGRTLILLKPSTYMNLSGNAVRYWLQKENIEIENMLVIVDDLALSVGTIRLRSKGSDGGHNGLKHIAGVLSTQNYARLRFGIGNQFGKGQQVDFVLGEWDNDEKKALEERIPVACEAVKTYALMGIERTMNIYNSK
jgi:peptidyl-tRNA hydrolase, PTH1 family